jgi:hypothetical protein
MLVMIMLIGAIGVSLLLLYWRNGKRPFAIWGQACIIVGFGLIAYALLRARSYWIGLAFALSALWQVSAIALNKIREQRDRKIDL